MNGLFWFNSRIDRNHMLKQRKIIDAWCELERACEEKMHIVEDAERVRKHCTDDLKTIKLERSYSNNVDRDMKVLYGYLIKQEEGRLSEQLKTVESFLLSIE